MKKQLYFPPTVCLSVISLLLLQFIVYIDFVLCCTFCWEIQLHKALNLVTLWSYPGPSFTKEPLHNYWV